MDAGGRLFRIGKSRCIDDRVRIKQHKVGMGALGNDPAPLETEPAGRQRRHAADRFVQGKQFPVACIVTEHPREGSPQPWVRMGIMR